MLKTNDINNLGEELTSSIIRGAAVNHGDLEPHGRSPGVLRQDTQSHAIGCSRSHEIRRLRYAEITHQVAAITGTGGRFPGFKKSWLTY